MEEEFPDWMCRLPERLHDRPLCRLQMPGSHDAAAYQLEQSMGIAVDRPDLLASRLVRWFPRFALPIIHKYSVTQSHSVYEQLRRGIRYLDLRIGLRPENREFYILHNLYGARLADIIAEIVAFSEQFPREVIILDLQHLWGFQTADDYERLADVLLAGLGPFLMAADAVDQEPVGRLTLRHFWNRGKQLFLCWRDGPSQDKRRSCFWPGADLVSPWADTTTPAVLYKFLDQAIENRPMDRFFVTQGVLTPHSQFVLMNPFGDLRWLAIQTRRALWPLLFGPPPPAPKIQRTNIVMVDFITETLPGDDRSMSLVAHIIQTNLNLDPN